MDIIEEHGDIRASAAKMLSHDLSDFLRCSRHDALPSLPWALEDGLVIFHPLSHTFL